MIILALAAAAAPTGPAKPATLQQQFEQASGDAYALKCSSALAGFAAIEARPAIAANARLRATIAARKATCLIRTGQREEGVKAAHVALATITPDSAVAREDLAGARLALGQASYFDHDYQAALVEFRQARDLLPAPDRGRALYWIAAAAMFEPTNEAVTAAEQGAAVTTASGDHESFGTMRARALLNRGQFQQGLADLERVVKVQGGLTTGKVTLQEVVTRSDLAIAALLNGNTDKAREYLAYTGAGRVEQSPFGLKGDTPAPACGGEGDLRPDDFAIVEFAIGASGAVLSATPIYVSRGGSDAAAAFARAVEGWSWEPATSTLR